jgi:hypothetical protein
MIRRVLLIAVVVALMLSGTTDSASALRRKGFNCSAILGYCKGIIREYGRFKFILILESPAARRSYTICVKPPRQHRECKSFKLVGGYSSVDFCSQLLFPAQGSIRRQLETGNQARTHPAFHRSIARPRRAGARLWGPL